MAALGLAAAFGSREGLWEAKEQGAVDGAGLALAWASCPLQSSQLLRIQGAPPRPPGCFMLPLLSSTPAGGWEGTGPWEVTPFSGQSGPLASACPPHAQHRTAPHRTAQPGAGGAGEAGPGRAARDAEAGSAVWAPQQDFKARETQNAFQTHSPAFLRSRTFVCKCHILPGSPCTNLATRPAS